jgi:hypothetical protein
VRDVHQAVIDVLVLLVPLYREELAVINPDVDASLRDVSFLGQRLVKVSLTSIVTASPLAAGTKEDTMLRRMRFFCLRK